MAAVPVGRPALDGGHRTTVNSSRASARLMRLAASTVHTTTTLGRVVSHHAVER